MTPSCNPRGQLLIQCSMKDLQRWKDSSNFNATQKYQNLVKSVVHTTLNKIKKMTVGFGDESKDFINADSLQMTGYSTVCDIKESLWLDFELNMISFSHVC